MIRDAELLDNPKLLSEKKLVIYGSGYRGTSLYRLLKRAGISIYAFGDSDREKTGKICLDRYVILSPEQIVEHGEELAVIVASAAFQKIICDLIERGFTGNLYTAMAVSLAMRMHYNYSFFPEKFRADYEEKLKWEQKTEDMLQANGYYSMWRLEELGRWTANIGLCENNIIILHPCKVASTTVDYSLRQKGISPLHRHNLLPYPGFRPNEQEIYDYFIECIKKEKVKLISLVREPLSHDFSLFFNFLKNPYQSWYQGFRADIETLFYEHIEKHYGEKAVKEDVLDSYEAFSFQCMLGGNKYGYFEWFEYEIKKLFGLDPLEYAFDTEKGYSIMKKKNIELLIVQMEKLDSLVPVLADYTGITDFRLNNTNVADEKEYQYIYKAVKEKIRYPQWYIDLYYKNNKYMNHFYSKEDQKNFLKNKKER